MHGVTVLTWSNSDCRNGSEEKKMLTGALIGGLVAGICACVYVWLQKRKQE